MKLPRAIIALLALACALSRPLAAQSLAPPQRAVRDQFEKWCIARLPVFELSDATFEQACDRLIREWQLQLVVTSYPFALADFEVDPDWKGETPRVTLSLKDIPYFEALDLICKATGRKLVPKAGPFRFQSGAPSGDWESRSYPLSAGLSDQLGLGSGPVRFDKASSAYQRLGIRFESWMSICAVGDRLLVLADGEQHQQIILINRLLEEGYTITPPRQK